MAQAKSVMDFVSEVSCDTSICSAMGPCVDREEGEEEETEPAMEVDKDHCMGGEDSAAGKQIVTDAASLPDVQMEFEVTKIIAYEEEGEFEEESANESSKQIENSKKELKIMVEKLEKELEQNYLRASQPQPEVKPPAPSELQPEVLPVTSTGHKERSDFTVQEHQSHEMFMGTLQKPDELELLWSRSTEKLEQKRTLQEPAEEGPGVEKCTTPEKVAPPEAGKMEDLTLEKKLNSVFYNNETMQKADEGLNAAEHLTKVTTDEVQLKVAVSGGLNWKRCNLPADNMVMEAKDVMVDEHATGCNFNNVRKIKDNGLSQQEEQVPISLNSKINTIQHEILHLAEEQPDMSCSGEVKHIPVFDQNMIAVIDDTKIKEERQKQMSSNDEAETKKAKESDVQQPLTADHDKGKNATENKIEIRESLCGEVRKDPVTLQVTLREARNGCQESQKSTKSFENMVAFERENENVSETQQQITVIKVDEVALQGRMAQKEHAKTPAEHQWSSICPAAVTEGLSHEQPQQAFEELSEMKWKTPSTRSRTQQKEGEKDDVERAEKEQDKDGSNGADEEREKSVRMQEWIGAVLWTEEGDPLEEISEEGVCKKTQQPGSVTKDEPQLVVGRRSNVVHPAQLKHVPKDKHRVVRGEGTKKEQPSPAIERVPRWEHFGESESIEHSETVTEDEPKKKCREEGRKVTIPTWLIASETSETESLSPAWSTTSRFRNVRMECEGQSSIRVKGQEVTVGNGIPGLEVPPPTVMQEWWDTKLPNISPTEQMQENVCSDPSNWEICLYVKVPVPSNITSKAKSLGFTVAH